MGLKVDANGVVTEGRFAGRHLDEVSDYIEGLEAAVGSSEAPKVDPPAPKKDEGVDAAARLAASNANRLDPLQQQILFTQELQDEQNFSGQVKDYAKYKKQIDELKKNLHPAQRAQIGIHRTLYIAVKSQDPSVSAALFKPVDEELPPVEEEEETPPPSPGVETPPSPRAAAAPPQRTPKPVPPVAAPTPKRPAPVKEEPKKSKLVPTDKIKTFCRQTGQDLDKYMLRLEEQGETQETINNAGQMGRREQPRSVYDRTRAAR